MLVGNKIDKVRDYFFFFYYWLFGSIHTFLNLVLKEQREVSREDGKRFAQKHHMLFIEASAKTSEGVQDAFTELVTKVHLYQLHRLPTTSLNLQPHSDHPDSQPLGNKKVRFQTQ